MKERIELEDALKHFHECEYSGYNPTVESLAGVLSIDRDHSARLMARLEKADLAAYKDGRHTLTRTGREYALHLVRAHRLYETHLARETGLSAGEWHHQAEIKEHQLSDAQVTDMATRLGDPRFDPHGDPIPTPTGVLPPPHGKLILERPAGWEGVVTHIEDEPESQFALIVSTGLAPGMRLRVVEVSPDWIRVNAEGCTIELSKTMAGLIRVAELKGVGAFDESITRLTTLLRGEKAAVVGLSPACRGPERSRLLDLGVVPGTIIEVDIANPARSLVAYSIRGAAIALREEQAGRILVRKLEDSLV